MRGATGDAGPDRARQLEIAYLQLCRGAGLDEVATRLVAKGLDSDEALAAVAELRSQRAAELRSAGLKHAIVGGLICTAGTVVTLVTLTSEGSQRVVIAWGAIVFGAAQALHGVSQFLKLRRLLAQPDVTA